LPYQRVNSVTEDEAKAAVEEKLRKQQLTKPMTEKELARFCDAMVRQLEMTSKTALSDVSGWAATWQSKWFQVSGQ
jgi:hypothetical protein